MRMREVLDLEKARVYLSKGIIKLEDTKNGERREVPLIPSLTKMLDEAINRSPNDNPYVFPNPQYRETIYKNQQEPENHHEGNWD